MDTSTLDQRNKQIMNRRRGIFNVANFKNLIRAVESAHPDDFTMETYANDCGTPACVLGHYASRGDLQSEFRLTSPRINMMKMVRNHAGHALSYVSEEVLTHFGLTPDEADALFSEGGCGQAGDDRDAALQYLRLFLKEREEEAQR